MPIPYGFKKAFAVRTQASKRITSLKVVILPILARLAWKQLQTGINMPLIITSTGDELFSDIDIDDFKWPWIFKIGVFSVFCDFWLRCTLQGWIATKWLKIDQDNLRTGTAKTVARFMSFAQMTCAITRPGNPHALLFNRVLSFFFA